VITLDVLIESTFHAELASHLLLIVADTSFAETLSGL